MHENMILKYNFELLFFGMTKAKQMQLVFCLSFFLDNINSNARQNTPLESVDKRLGFHNTASRGIYEIRPFLDQTDVPLIDKMPSFFVAGAMKRNYACVTEKFFGADIPDAQHVREIF